MAALCNRAGHIYFHSVVCSSFFLSSPNLSHRKLDVYHTFTHGANLECRSETCCKRLSEIQDAKKSPSGHHRTTLSDHICATKTRIDSRKKNLLSSNISSTCPHNMANFDPVAAEIDMVVWGTPANFNRIRILTALLHVTLVVGVGQTLRRLTEGATYIRQGGHDVGHWPTFLVWNYSTTFQTTGEKFLQIR